MSAHDDSTLIFTKQLDAVEHLQAQGFKVSKSRFNRDFLAGHISCTSDTRFHANDLMAYADAFLKAPTPHSKTPQQASSSEPSHQDVAMAELKGLALGVTADGKVVQEEAAFLLCWLDRNAALAKVNFAAGELHRRVRATLEDGVLSTEESRELLDVIRRLVLPEEALASAQVPDDPSSTASNLLPLKPLPKTGRGSPPPDPYTSSTPLELIPPRSDILEQNVTVTFPGYAFCHTGIFAMGGRQECESQTSAMGGDVIRRPRRKRCYVVVGSIASPGWLHGDYGTKIEEALQMKREGADIHIIHEDVWAAAMTERQAQQVLL